MREYLNELQKLKKIPFLQDSDVIITSAPKPLQQSAILSSSVATTAQEDKMYWEISSKIIIVEP